MPGSLAERGVGHVGDARGLGDDGLGARSDTRES